MIDLDTRTPANRRDHAGRYQHDWGWQGFDAYGDEWQACNDCGKWKVTGSAGIVDSAPELRPSPEDWHAKVCKGCSAVLQRSDPDVCERCDFAASFAGRLGHMVADTRLEASAK